MCLSPLIMKRKVSKNGRTSYSLRLFDLSDNYKYCRVCSSHDDFVFREFQRFDDDESKKRFVYNLQFLEPFQDDDGNLCNYVAVACGKCVDCLEVESTVWAFRIAQEASLYDDNIMLTLTYENDPVEGVVKRDVQLFMKRLRERYSNITIRFFACGEYGGNKGRPHYHVILFNFKPDDMVFYRYSKKHKPVYKSKSMEDVWHNGLVFCSDITLRSAKYSAKYLQKIQPVSSGRNKPFTLMSNRPGIGYECIRPDILLTDKIYVDGKYIKTPRYYLKKLEEFGFDLTELRENRIRKSESFKVDFDKIQARANYLKERLDRDMIIC